MNKDGERRFYAKPAFWLALAIPVLLGIYVLLLLLSLPPLAGEEATLSEFVGWVEEGSIEDAVLYTSDQRVLLTVAGEERWVGLPRSPFSETNFVAEMLEAGVPLRVEQQPWKDLLIPATYAVPAMLIVAAFGLFIVMMRGGSMPFLRSGARTSDGKSQTTFADVAGLDDAVAEVREVRDYLADPDSFARLGVLPPRGVLLVGPPGTGKTLLARAVAGEAGVEFLSISGSDFTEMYVGVGAARVRDVFRAVRAAAPAILFIDELDAVGRARGGGAVAGRDERDQTLNQLLIEIDGFERDAHVILIAATNRPDIIDPALLRPGRFDRRILVDRPDRKGREAILRVHLAGKSVGADVDPVRIASDTSGLTGADLASMCNEAGLLAARRGQSAIGARDIDLAIDRVLRGSDGQTHLLTPEEKRVIAYHEAGHAIVSWAMANVDDAVRRVSIVARGHRLGQTTSRIVNSDRIVVTQQELEGRLAVSLGGRAAEELTLESPTVGSVDDLRAATALATEMVCDLGMSEVLGRRSLGVMNGATMLGDDTRARDFSGEVAVQIDREIRRILDEAFARATDVLRQHRDVLDELAERLVERETLQDLELVDLSAKVGRIGPDEPLAVRAVSR